jgi:hypothetical protein
VDGLIVSLGAGVEIIPGWMPTRSFRVAVLDYDEGEDEERVRLHAMTNFYDLDMAGYAYTQMSRPLAESADEIGPWLLDHRAEVLVISHVNRALRSERTNDPGSPVNELYECLREFGTTNILIDHVVGADIGGGAIKQYGAVAKVNNERGSYLIEQIHEEPGRRVVSLKNRKPDALTPRQTEQSIQISFDPPWPKPDGSYDHISFSTTAPEAVDADYGVPIRVRIRRALDHLGRGTAEEIAAEIAARPDSVKRTLNRYSGEWFAQLATHEWERLPESKDSGTVS